MYEVFHNIKGGDIPFVFPPSVDDATETECKKKQLLVVVRPYIARWHCCTVRSKEDSALAYKDKMK